MLDYANADLRLGVLGENPERTSSAIKATAMPWHTTSASAGSRSSNCPSARPSAAAPRLTCTATRLRAWVDRLHRLERHLTAAALKAIFGVSYRPTDKWNFEFDADYTDWSVERTLVVSPTALGPVGLPLNWQPSWYFEFGGTRYLDKGWYVSAGYIYNENSVPNANYTRWWRIWTSSSAASASATRQEG